MATMAFDLATIMHALLAFECEIGAEELKWDALNSEQGWMFDFMKNRREDVSHLKHINSQAVREGMEIKVTSVLDKTVRWMEGVAEPEIIRKKRMIYPAFKLKEGCEILSAEGFGKEPVLIIKTKNGDLLYIAMMDEALSGLDMFKKAHDLLCSRKTPHPEYKVHSKAILPKVDFNLSPDISFVQGALTKGHGIPWYIAEAIQKFKFRMNEEGARAVVETSLMFFGCSLSGFAKKELLIVDRPFLGFFVQPGIDIPLAVFWADFDSWKDVGKLAEL